MSEHWCRICGGQVVSPESWVELPRLGRFWLCPTHNEGEFTLIEMSNVGYAYVSAATGVFVLGPYPYEPGWKP